MAPRRGNIHMRLGLLALLAACDGLGASKLPYEDCWNEELIPTDSALRSDCFVLRLRIAMEDDMLAVAIWI